MHRHSALVASVLLFTLPAFAGDFYIGGSIGVSMIDDTVDTAATSFVTVGERPDEISLKGRPFDSNETASGITVGWNARDWLAVEFAFTDFGNTGQEIPTAFFGPVATVTPAGPPVVIPPNFGEIRPFAIISNVNAAALGVEEWSIAARFRKSLVSNLAANWSVGITRTQFEAEGQLTFSELVTLEPLVVNRFEVPYASPKSETGFNFGFGVEWRFGDRFFADIGYRRHDTRVLDIETVTLRLMVTL